MHELTATQLAEWEAYNKIEPIGEWVEDFRTSQLLSMMVNLARQMVPRKKGSAPPKMTAPKDYMPEWYKDTDASTLPVKKQSVAEMKQILRALAGVGKKGVKRKKLTKPRR